MPAEQDALIALRQKLGIASTDRPWLCGHHAEAKHFASRIIGTMQKLPQRGPIDVAIITPRSCDEAGYFANKLRNRLCDPGTIWIVLAQSPGNETEIGMNALDLPTADNIQTEFLNLGFRPTGHVKLNDRFQALGFKT